MEEPRIQRDQPDDQSYSLMQVSTLLERIGVINEAESDDQAITQSLALICELAGWQSGRGILIDQRSRSNDHDIICVPLAGLQKPPCNVVMTTIHIDDLISLSLNSIQ